MNWSKLPPDRLNYCGGSKWQGETSAPESTGASSPRGETNTGR
ncbi:MAG: hypothetical protein [Microvirus sp.]|nr:MAG: hypothetical protein [Microvirus sp.]